MRDPIETMTDIDIHDELAELWGNPTFEQEVDRMMHFHHPEVYPDRVTCERIYRRRLADNRASQVAVLRLLRAEDVTGEAVTGPLLDDVKKIIAKKTVTK